eukprot:gene4984-3579_t
MTGGKVLEEQHFVSVETIIKKIAPLCKIPEKKLIALLNEYDTDRVGGLSETQWRRFCQENRHLITTLRVEMIDHSGEDPLMTVRQTGEYPRQSKRVTQGVIQFLDGFVAGGVAGAISKTVIAPGDRVKIIFQVDSTRTFSLREAFFLGVHTVKEYGITGLWIGNGATMLRVVPYAAITYISFDFYQSKFAYLLKKYFNIECDERQSVLLRFVCGALAGATSTTCTYPLDLMRARFAANSTDKKTRFPSYRVAFQRATKKDGIRSLYSGLFPTVVGIMPYAGCSFACFETIKHRLVLYYGYNSDKDIPTWQRLIAGGFSGLMAQSTTYPLDIVRRRMQVSPKRYRGIADALSTVYREEGLRQGLFKGLTMNWIKGPIAVATSFTVNDLIKRRTRQYHDTPPMPHTRRSVVTFPEAFLCGGVAAGVAKFWTLPFDKIKIMHQLGIHDTMKGNLRSARNLKDLLVKNPNMWASGNVTMMRVIPYGAITYSIFDVSQTIAERAMYSHEPTVVTNFVGGATAASVGTFIVYPLDLIRTRSAANIIPKFQSYFWLMRAMSRRHGISSLWEGCYISMMGIGWLAGIGFAMYEYLKKKLELESFSSRLLAGMVAGITGQAVTWPMNVLKRKRQVEIAACTNAALMSRRPMFGPHFFASIYARMPLSWTMSSLAFGISFAVNDLCRELIGNVRRDMVNDLFFSSKKTDSSEPPRFKDGREPMEPFHHHGSPSRALLCVAVGVVSNYSRGAANLVSALPLAGAGRHEWSDCPVQPPMVPSSNPLYFCCLVPHEGGTEHTTRETLFKKCSSRSPHHTFPLSISALVFLFPVSLFRTNKVNFISSITPYPTFSGVIFL